ncbi:MAG: cytochrome c1 [Pelagibacterales bacterium]|nr:cytochrome c1 [Pelagibacterales bacterium]|tara:strand:+ start:1214 stop:1966 length:753 start_codon:yes stop_codon:yes gene_type:complete
MKIIFFIIIITSFTTQPLLSATDSLKPMQYNFSFNGIFGGIDKNSAQRGLQVFTEVCASCHGLNHLAYRNLEDIGYNKTQINSIAKQFLIDDIPDENGEIKKRNAIYSDKFVNPYPNEEAAKVSNNGAYPPDLTLIVKARKDGANYLRSLLLGYEDAPNGFDVGEGYYNKYMPGNVIAMPQPLYGEDVEYQDGTVPTLEQEVIDVVTFLTWTAMPELEKRKSSGIKVIIFLVIMTIFFFLSYRKIWKDVK